VNEALLLFVERESARNDLGNGNLDADTIKQDLFGTLGARGRCRAAIVVVVAARDRVAASLLGGQWARDEGRPGCR
jgi:hypothetical protein